MENIESTYICFQLFQDSAASKWLSLLFHLIRTQLWAMLFEARHEQWQFDSLTCIQMFYRCSCMLMLAISLHFFMLVRPVVQIVSGILSCFFGSNLN